MGWSFPVPGQELVDLSYRMIGQPCENVGEPGVRIDVVELGSLDERIEGEAAAFVGAGKGPVAASDGDQQNVTFAVPLRVKAIPPQDRSGSSTLQSILKLRRRLIPVPCRGG